ncbi:unnamed protein product, partial [Mesorhabditis spiculigera]
MMSVRWPSFGLPLALVTISVLVAVGSCAPSAVEKAAEPSTDSLDKRGGARAFRGMDAFFPSAKRLSGGSPYFFLDKRAGGRAFHSGGRGSWGGGLGGFRLERRGGGRAFAGDWSGDAMARYYDSPYLYKRSLDAYNYLPYEGYY